LLINDEQVSNECEFYDKPFCGLDEEYNLALVQYRNPSNYGEKADYLTNEEFFAIALDDDIDWNKAPEGATHYSPKTKNV
jgi:hypothetical protein